MATGPLMFSSHEDEVKRRGYAGAFQSHTVFLTGGTGSLGGCLLYKLALQLPTRKIFVLIRGSPEVAEKKWSKTMPKQTSTMLASNRIHFVVGDMTKPDFGIDAATLRQLGEEVTLVIHAGARIALDANIVEALENNCFPSLELARMASSFTKLKLFIQISTAYVNSFLPDGYVAERLYAVSDEDPEDEIAAIHLTGSSPHTKRFSSSYTQAKYLMERLMLKRYPVLPLLLVRPTIFGSALRYPYPLYGPDASTPMNKFASLLLSDRGGKQIWHAAQGYTSGTNILDEIPVDFVANACLLHAAARTQGIVQIGSELYFPLTFDDFLNLAYSSAPEEYRQQLPAITFVQDKTIPQSFLAELVKVATRNWAFECGRSSWLRQMGGPLSFTACRHEVDKFNAARTKEIYKRTLEKMAKL
ncbi:hypothetical protein AOCH_004021 [Aspergillus ochraceoroseus]|uniref:Fatty acyl-CoA reductase n=2 Tax=Aspergillus ochraceoroseus TaxID=138278 RepID=A0A0F8WQS1_9EURO|nr:hypothetical protein AOCH_004021 [Aspergillus ochraceoroseus]